ncbi:PD-(D/E)XK nuclease family protein [Halioxenophilus aromaticivorans]|uniref:PD-(D/E)XK nuclease family protein n=2 Tax=Halioxenophilus aromaticivorans TaxID=1306992 RepID=A0AAV3UA60_9ALTE
MRAAYAQATCQHQQVIKAPALYSINTWIDHQWQQLLRAGIAEVTQCVVLNSAQRLALWKTIIDADIDALPLVKTDQLYAQADAAYRNLMLWQLGVGQCSDNDPVHGLFQKWFRRFDEQLKSNRWLIPEQKQEILLHALQNGELATLTELHLLGFDDIAPLTHCLLQTAANKLVEHAPSAQPKQSLSQQRWPNRATEIAAASAWSKKILADDSDVIIGIIAPNLGQIRNEIEQIFSETFELTVYDINQPRYTLPFNFSAGTPLASAPVIADAFALLKWMSGQIPFDSACALLSSPFWIACDHAVEAGHALNRLYQYPKEFISSTMLRRALEQTENSELLPTMLDIDQQIRLHRSAAAPSQWMDFLLSTLQQLGWPGRRRLDSVEYQQVSQFQSLLEEFTSTTLVRSRLSFEDGLAELLKLAQSTPFQAKTPDSPIQILGALEGAALNFDYCWVLNCDNQTWPPPPSPNPLLPIELQRQHNMPNASAGKQLEYAQSLTQRLKHCAPTVVFSSSETDGESELNPSGLINDLPLLCEQQPEPPKTDWQQLTANWFATSTHSWVDCATAPSINTAKQQQSGGVSVIQWQAAMPFNAFCRYRLNLRPIPAIEHHLSASLRGQITHAALASFWQQVNCQENLLQLDEENLVRLISRCVADAIENLPGQHEQLTPERKLVEQERQTAIINQWLAVEKTRPDFNVTQIEQAIEADIQGIIFKLQFDRIDQTGEQEYVILDYKSGATSSSKQWRPERLVAPQLPLYACFWPEQIAAVSFAVVNGKQQKFDGVGELSVDITGVQKAEKIAETDWPTLKANWLADLNRTVAEFKSGITYNHIYDNATVQYQTDYLGINRLQEINDNFRLWSAEVSHNA